MSKGHSYTQQELDFMVENHDKMTAKELAAAMGKPKNSIVYMLWRKFKLHLKKDYHQKMASTIENQILTDYQQQQCHEL